MTIFIVELWLGSHWIIDSIYSDYNSAEYMIKYEFEADDDDYFIHEAEVPEGTTEVFLDYDEYWSSFSLSLESKEGYFKYKIR